MKKYFFYFLKIVLSFLLLYWLFNQINWRDLANSLYSVSWPYFLLSFIFCVVTWVVATGRWRYILNRLGLKISFLNLLSLNLVSLFYSSFLPGGQATGELIKCYRVISFPQDKLKLVYSVLVDKLVGFSAAVILGLIALVLLRLDQMQFRILLLIYLISAFGLGFITVFNFKLISFFKNLIDYFSPRGFGFECFAGQFLDIKSSLISLILALIFQIFNVFYIYLLALSFGVSVNFIDLFWIIGLLTLILFVPVTFFGLGLRDVSLVYLFGLVSVSSAGAVSISLSIFIFGVILGILGWIWDRISNLHSTKIL